MAPNHTNDNDIISEHVVVGCIWHLLSWDEGLSFLSI